MFVAGEADLPRATPLSSASILEAMGVRGAAGAAGTTRAAVATGNIRSIAAAADGRIYFYFAGGRRKESLLCLGQFNPRTGDIRVLADTQQLARDSGMGGSLALARPTVVADGRFVWLWLRHTDASAVFRIDTTALPSAGPATLTKPFPRLTAARKTDGAPIELTREEDYEVSPGARPDTLLLTDLYAGALWEMTEHGEVRVLHSLVGLPRALSILGVLREQSSAPVDPTRSGVTPGSVVSFAADSDPIPPRVAERVDPVELQIVYPALLILRPDQPGATPAQPPPSSSDDGALRQSLTTRLIAIGRDQLHAQRGLAVHTMQVQQLVYEPTRDTWLGYDSPSGQLVRITIIAK
jgi:hypothetical protein